MSQPIEIESIKRLDVKPGETLIVKLPIGATREIVEEARERLTQRMPKGVEFIVVSGDVEFMVLGRSEP